MTFLKSLNKYKIGFYDKLVSISTMYSGATKNNYKEIISESLNIFGEYMNVDRIYIFEYDFINNECRNTFEYTAKGITKESENLQKINLSSMESWVTAHNQNKVINIYRTDQLKFEDDIKCMLEKQGIKSVLSMALFANEELFGFIGLDSVKRKRKFSSFENNMLKYFSILLTNLILKYHHFIKYNVDNFELKKIEEKLRVITTAIDYSPIAVVITDIHGTVIHTNPIFKTITGFEVEEFIGKKFNLLRSGAHSNEFYGELWKSIKRGKTWHGEIYNKKKDGSYYWEDTTISPVFDENNKLINFIAIKFDITKKKEADNYLLNERKALEMEVNDKIIEILNAQKASIIALAKLAESRDYDTGKHIERVQFLSKTLASQMKEHVKYKEDIDKDFIENIFYASALHDLGKIRITDGILLKPGKLTTEEFNEMKNHVTYGVDILMEMVRHYPKSDMIIMGIKIAKYHHEKYDGLGYLEGLTGDEIPLEARIMAVVDVYDALRTKRSYKDTIKHNDACEIIVKSSGTHFDPTIVEVFMSINRQIEVIYDSLT